MPPPAAPSTAKCEEVPDRLALSPASLDRFCRFITAELGIRTSRAKLPMLQSRLQRRLRELRLPTLEAYQDFLFNSEAGQAERIHFIDAVTTNKTDFFREAAHFDFLLQHALPALRPKSASGSWFLKLWCAGCSTGEEAYTLAMVLGEHAASAGSLDFSILATDISTRVLDHARRAIYDASRVEPVAQPLRAKYLLRSRNPTWGCVRIAPVLRDRVTFRRLNFMDASYGIQDQFHVVFFRNVLIYFDKPTQEAVIARMLRNLVPGGILFVGHSESLAGLVLPLRAIGTAVYRHEP